MLEQLLFYLSDKDWDLGKDPYAFAMTWTLVALINEYVQPVIDVHERSQSASDYHPAHYDPSLLEEFVSWWERQVETRSFCGERYGEIWGEL